MSDYEEEYEWLRDVLHQIEQWVNAYPEDVFQPVSADDMQEAMHVLRDAGISIGDMHAQWARQILDGIRKIIHA